jgi:hypothetical protein
MDIFEEIKRIALEALEKDRPEACESALRDILFHIEKEDEYFRLRNRYYRRDYR